MGFLTHRPYLAGKVRTITASICAGFLCVSTASCTSEEANTTHSSGIAHLKMADSYSLKHPVGEGGTEPFIDKMDREPTIKIEYFASGQLGKQTDMPSIIRSGLADMGVISPSYVSSTFPLSSVGDLPGFSSDSCVTAYALRDLVRPGGILYETELKKMKFLPLWTGSIPGYEAMTGGKSPATPKSFEGAVLRSTGGALDRVIDQLGAAGVAMPIGDMYEAMARGTVEGTLASPISITPYGLEEVVTDSTLGAAQGNFTFFYGINLDTWNSLTSAQQHKLQDAAEQSQQSVCTKLNESRDASIEEMKKAGVRFHDVSANRGEWEKTSTPVLQHWIEDAEKVGLPASAVVREFQSALEHHAHRSESDGHAQKG